MSVGRRLLVLGLAVLLASAPLGGCGDSEASPSWVQDLSDDASEQIELSTDADGSTLTSASGPTGSASPPTSAGDPVPPLDLSGDDLDAVWRSMQAYERWVLAHPDPSLLDAIYVDGTEIHTQSVELVEELRAAGAHMVVGDYEIVDVEVIEVRPGEEATLRYQDSRSFREVIAADGTVVEREEYEGQPWTWELRLEVDDAGDWQIAEIDFVEESA